MPSMPASASQTDPRPGHRPMPARARPAGAWYRREEAIMGTAITVELWSAERALAERALAAVIAEMHRIDAAMSPHKPTSELSRINRNAADRPVPLGDEMYTLLE